MLYKHLSGILRDFRAANSLTQEKVAERLQISKRTYQRLERGERKLLEVRDLERISELTGRDISELLKT